MAAMSAAPGRFDALLTRLAQQHGGVESLLDSFFDFLHRKTDFYVVASDPAVRGMGFQPGQAQDKVMRAFLKFPFKRLDGDEGGAEARAPAGAGPTGAVAAPPSSGDAAGSRSKDAHVAHVPQSSLGHGDRLDVPAEARPLVADVQVTDEGKQVPVGNGGATEVYSWTQTLADVSIQVELPVGTKAADLDCEISATRLRVALKPKGGEAGRVLLDGELPERIRADESLWSVEGHKTLLVSLDKARETWWASVLKGEPEIDTTKVDSSRRIDEYDEATQGAIRKIVHEQRQRQLGEAGAGGRPLTAEEQLLERAKQLPGSPFT